MYALAQRRDGLGVVLILVGADPERERRKDAELRYAPCLREEIGASGANDVHGRRRQFPGGYENESQPAAGRVVGCAPYLKQYTQVLQGAHLGLVEFAFVPGKAGIASMHRSLADSQCGEVGIDEIA